MKIAIVGFGEVGRIFFEDLSDSHEIVAWDIAFSIPGSPASTNAVLTGVTTATSASEAVTHADFVVSAVTAANTLAVAEAVAPGLEKDALFFDLNSAAPGHKQEAADVIHAAGGRYIEAALMSPIGPRRLNSPFMLGGPHAQEFATAHCGKESDLKLDSAVVVSDKIGVAAATKLCRSVIVKGLESLFGESLLAARHYGVEKEVIESLNNILPEADWEPIASYFISRSLQHGTRRSEEMFEAARTVSEAGYEPRMASAAAEHEAWAAQFKSAFNPDNLTAMLDGINTAARKSDS